MEANYQLIILEQGNIITSDEDIVKGELFIVLPKAKILIAENGINVHDGKTHKKIVASNNPGHNLPSIDYNGLEEKFGIIDIEKEIADFISHKRDFLVVGLDPVGKFEFGMKKGFELGKKFQPANDKNFSLEDVKYIIDVFEIGWVNNLKPSLERVIQNLRPTVFNVEVDMMLQVRHGVEWHDLPNQTEGRDSEGIYRRILKITNGV